MIDNPREPVDNPRDIERLQHQARQVYYASSLIALGLTAIILVV